MSLYSKFALFVGVSLVLIAGVLTTYIYVMRIQRPLEFFSRVSFTVDSAFLILALVMAVVFAYGLVFYVKERVLKTG